MKSKGSLSFDYFIRSLEHVKRNRHADLLRRFWLITNSNFVGCWKADARLAIFQDFMISLTKVYRPRDCRSFTSIASMSRFAMAPSFRSTIVRLMVRKIPATEEGKSNPAPFQLVIR